MKIRFAKMTQICTYVLYNSDSLSLDRRRRWTLIVGPACRQSASSCRGSEMKPLVWSVRAT